MIDNSQHNQQDKIIFEVKTTYDKNELLNKIKQLKKTTRKPRSDKGTQRGPNSKIRSDAGIQRGPMTQAKEPLTVYLIVKTRLFKSAKDEDYNVYQDQDGFYIPRPAPTKTIYKNYIVTNQGMSIPRTIKHVQGKDIDLEQYRYQALQDKAILTPLELIPDKYQQQLSQEIRKTQATNWLELFTNWYFLSEEEVLTTSYQQWRDKHYGTPDEQDCLNKILLSKKYENEHARVRDREYSKVFEKIKIDVLNNPHNWSLTMSQIDKVVRQQIKDQGLDKEIDNIVQQYMAQWVEEQKEK